MTPLPLQRRSRRAGPAQAEWTGLPAQGTPLGDRYSRDQPHLERTTSPTGTNAGTAAATLPSPCGCPAVTSDEEAEHGAGPRTSPKCQGS
jgi:hypothetical protein